MLNRINSQQPFPASRFQLYLGRALKLLKQLLWRVILVTLPGYGASCSGVRGGGQRAPRCRSPREREAGLRSHRPDPSSRLGPELRMQSAVLKSLRPGSSPDSKVTPVLPVSAGTEDQRWPQALPIRRSAGPGTRTSLLYGKGARVCDNVTPAGFGGKSPAFGFLWWRAKDGLVRKGGR